ncbi:MAG: 16S rRNA (cytosine(1402)-N(4))-methyltransferase RsmH [Candidatus Eiseniibacteriota bacterium]
MTSMGHIPVLLSEVIEVLRPRADGIYVDGTFGSGGYARALLDAAPCRVLGIDRDPEAVKRGDEMARRFDGRLTVLHGRFGDMVELLQAREVTEVDGVAFDFGVSSMQIDDPARGFSFRQDGPLDMRMDPTGASAADVVNTLDESALADLIFSYGEERRARRVAKAIVTARAEKPITRTGELAEIVRRAVPPSKDGIDPATRTFQALRIHVNDELGQIDAGLAAAETLLRAGGRLAAVSFHSLEDRRVKEFLRTRSGAAPRASRHLPAERGERQPTFATLSRRPVRPGADELAANPRARSARLRAAERTAAPAWDAHPKGHA